MYVASTMAGKLAVAEKLLKECLDYDVEHTVFDAASRLKVGIALDKVLSTRSHLDNEIAACIEAYQ